MKKIYLSLAALIFPIALILFSQTKIYSQPTWTEMNGVGMNQPASEVPYPRGGFTCLSVAGKVYLGMGYIEIAVGVYVGYGDLNGYDPATNKWHQYPDIPDRANAATFAIANKGYIGFGTTDWGTPRNDLWEFDPPSGTWSQKASFPDTARTVNFSFAVNGKGYIGAGSVNDFWQYDPVANAWTFISTLPFNGGSYGAPFTINTNSYIVGLNSTKKYDALSGTWSTVAPYPAAYIRGSFELQSLGYVVGDSTLFQYDPVADQWNQKASLPEPMWGAGGSDGNFGCLLLSDASVFKYDASADSWTQVCYYSDYIANTYQFHITKKIVLNNLVYSTTSAYDPAIDQWTLDTGLANSGWMFGLNNIGYAMRGNIFQKYDPVSGNWTPLTSITFPLGKTFSANGKGYSVLAMDSLNNPIHDLWEYDPVNDSWTIKADYPGHQGNYASVFSIADKGYIVGGEVDTNQFLASPEFWQYDPTNDTWIRKTDYPGYIEYYNIFTQEYNGKGYAGLGKFDPTGPPGSDIYSYEPSNDSWTQIVHPLGSRSGLISFSINNALYLGLGSQRISQIFSYRYSDLWRYTDSLTTSLNNIPLSNKVFLYPNPASNQFTVSGGHSSTGEIEIFNALGERIFLAAYHEPLTVNCELFSAGIYFVKLTGERGSVVKKLVVQGN